MEDYTSPLMKRYAKEKAEQEHIDKMDRLENNESFGIKIVLFFGDESLAHSLLLLNCMAMIFLFQFYAIGNFEYLFYHKMLGILYIMSSVVFCFNEFNFFNSHMIASVINITALVVIEKLFL